MKLKLFSIFSLYTLGSFSVFATPISCTEKQKQINVANNIVTMLDFHNGPVKSIITTSTLSKDGRFKAYQNETRLDECGSLTKHDFSAQEYIHEHIETNLMRMPEPYNLKYKYQLKNRNRTHTLYLNEIYNKNEQNQLTNKIAYFYDASGLLLGSESSQFFYKNGYIITEKVTKSDAGNKGNTVNYQYDTKNRLLKVVENNETTLEFTYDKDGKVLHQFQLFSSLYDDIREFNMTCNEWDKYNNCLTWDLVTTVKSNDQIINTTKAVIHDAFEYYE
ncbi:hypothetical protein [Proteus hauseri]|uniref:hypothetical protein n=1 Tax=Proteus hauseri TaxID=183417 RepID=UPI0032DAB7A5